MKLLTILLASIAALEMAFTALATTIRISQPKDIAG
jgi:hypothetical protein